MKSIHTTKSTRVNRVNKVNRNGLEVPTSGLQAVDRPVFVDPVDVVDPTFAGQQQVKPGPTLCPTCGRGWLVTGQKCGLCGKTYREGQRPALRDPERGAGRRRLEAEDRGN